MKQKLGKAKQEQTDIKKNGLNLESYTVTQKEL